MTHYLLQWLANPRSGVFPCSALILLFIALGLPVAAIEVQVPSAAVTGGSLNVPFGGGSLSKERVQSIYLASEIGTTGKIRSLTATFTSIPNFTLNNFTIRMKNTTLASFATATWDSGFTTVFSGTVTVSSAGPYTFVFTTPFNYTGGSNNLIVDMSWQNGSVNSMDGSINYTNTTSGGNRSLWYRDSGAAAGAPTSWTGATPTPNGAVWVPNVYLGISSRLHVKTVASGRGNGIDWDNALGNLTTALGNSASGDEIWVAMGTYKPSAGSRSNSFVMKNGVHLFGGYAGTGPEPDQRRMSNQTILSGDIGPIVSPSANWQTDNSYHVVTGASNATLDGFIIRDGFANGAYGGIDSGGGGLICNLASPTVRNCVFTANDATYVGGAIYIVISGSASATIDNCVFVGNGSVNCDYGGAIMDGGGLSTTVRNCSFSGNNADNGGTLELFNGGTISLIDCVLWGNDSQGEEIYNNGKHLELTNCTVKGGSGQFASPTGSYGDGGGNDANDPLYFAPSDPDGPDNLFGTGDDGLTLMSHSPAVDNGISGGLSTDVAGRWRPSGGLPDRGAYELPVVYVSALALGVGDGTGWGNAYTQLSDAMAAATTGPVEFWVRAGTYKPTSGTDRTQAFALRTGMGLYGGFGGLETTRAQRDWRMRLCTLSGDIGTIGVPGDNSYHVVTAVIGACVIDGFLIRDGVANQAYPNNFGGGLYSTVPMAVRRCLFFANAATFGAGWFAEGGSATAEQCLFLSNTASQHGGGAFFQSLTAGSVRDTVFWRNSGSSGANGGGGLFVESSAGVTVSNSSVVENTVAVGGGGIQCLNSAVTMRNLILWGNTTGGSPNQIANTGTGSSNLIECLVQGGLPGGSTDGGGLQVVDPLFLDSASPLGVDNIPGSGDDGLTLRLDSPAIGQGTSIGVASVDLAGNQRQIGAVDLGAYERLNVVFVDRDAVGLGTGNSWANARPSLASALTLAVSGRDEIWIAEGTYRPTTTADRTVSFTLAPRVALYGGFAGTENRLTQRSLATRRVVLSGDIDQDGSLANNSAHVLVGADAALVDGVTITGGNADGTQPVIRSNGGAGFLDEQTSTTLVNCIFLRNESTFIGGGLLSYENSMTQIRGCLFAENRSDYGGAFFIWEASVGLANVTCSGNSASSIGGSTYLLRCQATISNAILWGDSLPALYNNNSSVWIAGSDVQGSGGSGGSWDFSLGSDQGGNLDADPNFRKEGNPTGSDGIVGTDDDGLRLLAGSPCVDSGVRGGGPIADLLGSARPSGAAIDQGAYEGQVVEVAFQLSTSSGLESLTSPSLVVRLSQASDLPVTVTYARAAGVTGGTATLTSDFTLGLLTLTFTPGEVTKSLNLNVVNDAVEEANETIGFVLLSATNARIDGTTLHTYTILNNDSAGITTSPTVLSINESGAPTSATFSLSLTSTPADGASVSVTVTSSSPSEAVLSFGAVTLQSSVTVVFSSGNYGSKTVTVTSVDDFIDDGNFSLTATTAPAVSADPFYSGKDAADVQVTVVDNDDVGLVLSKTTVAVSEATPGVTDSFTVKLRSQPTSTVTVLVTSSNNADATVSTGSLTFGTNRFGANGWDETQTVTVTAVNDQVDEPGTNSVAFAVNLDANSGVDLKYDAVSASVSGTLTDNDTADFVVTPLASAGTQTPVENGGTVVYSVVLASKPTAPVTIGTIAGLIRSSDTGEGTVSTTTLTFGINSGLGGWDSAQTITVTAVDDFVKETNPDYNLIIPSASSSDPKYQGLFSTTRPLRNTDDDNVGVIFTPASGLVTTEVGGTASFTVRLKSQPVGANTVSFTLVALQAGGSHQGELSLDGTTFAGAGGSMSLTFNTSTTPPSGTASAVTAGWNQSVTVTIRGLNDTLNTTSQAYFIQRSASTSSDPAYVLAQDSTAVAVNNQSQDAAGVTVNPTALSVTEAAGATRSATFTVKLAKQPTQPVGITLSQATNPAQVSLSTTSLSFSITTDAVGGWNLPQTVTVTAVDDGIDDGDLISNLAFAVSSSDGTYNGLAVPVLPVTSFDNDTRGFAVTPTTGLTTTEAGGQAIFIVSLTSQPTAGTVTLNLTSSDTGEGRIRLGTSGIPGTGNLPLTFDALDWNIPKVVSVVGQDDALDDGTIAYQVTFNSGSGSGDYTTLPALPGPVSVVNQDDDTARVLLSRTSMNLDEDPAMAGVHQDTYTIVLGSEPTGNVTVAIDPGTKATADVPSVLFTSGNWFTPVTVTITAVDDVVAEGTHDAVVVHSVTSSDSVYQGIAVNDVTATITDDDTAFVTPSATPATLTTVETVGGTPDEIRYVLNTQPRGNVTILLTSTDPTEAVPVPDRLTFTATDYNDAAAHVVTVRGVDDDVADGNGNFRIVATAISADGAYNGLTITDVDGINQDDDVVGVVFTATTLGTPLFTSEAGTATTFTVRLASEPLADVTVPIASTNTDEGKVAVVQPLNLVFTPSNWDTDQIVTVTGERDFVDEATSTTAYTVTAGPTSGPGSGYTGAVLYNGVAAANGVIHLANTDIDQAGVLITPTTGLVTSESGATASYTVVLTSKPAHAVRVTINPGSPAQLAAVAALDFTTTTWSTPQTVTVSAVNDDIAEGTAGIPHTGTLTHGITFPGSTDTTYAALGTISSVTALITDDDTPGIVLNQIDPAATDEDPLDPQAISTFSINLLSEPTSMVRITVTSSDPTEILLSTDGIRANATTSVTLDILAANWDSITPPVITAFGVNDDIDDGNQVVNVTVAVVAADTADARYDVVSAVVYQITNHDKDTAGVTIVEPTHGLNFPAVPADLSENVLATTYSYTLVLDSEPTGNVTINLSETGQVLIDTDSVTAGNQTSVVFTPTKDQVASGNTAGWNVPLTVTVTAVDDLGAETSPHSTSVVHVASGGGYTGVTVASVALSIADNDSSTPPVVTLPGTNPFAYDETGHLARIFDSGATVGDVDSPSFQTGNVTVTITAGNVPAEDELGVASEGTAAGQIGVVSSVITYNPIADTGAVQIGTVTSPGTGGSPLVIALAAADPTNVSIEAVQALLRRLTYRNASLNPTLAARTLSLTVNDGDGGTSTAVTKNITITPFDDPPSFAAQNIITVVDQTIAGTLTGSDPEGLALTFTKLTDPLNGTVTVAANGGYTYVPLGGDFANTYTFTVQAADPALNLTTATITIHITGGDETRPQLLSSAPLETELGARFAVLTFNPASTSGSPLTFRVVDQSTADITFTVTPLSNTPTSVTAQVNWQIISAMPTTGDHFTLGIIVTDPGNSAASYIPVTIQLVQPNGPG